MVNALSKDVRGRFAHEKSSSFFIACADDASGKIPIFCVIEDLYFTQRGIYLHQLRWHFLHEGQCWQKVKEASSFSRSLLFAVLILELAPWRLRKTVKKRGFGHLAWLAPEARGVSFLWPKPRPEVPKVSLHGHGPFSPGGESAVRITLSAIKADVGSVGGHLCPSREVIARVREFLKGEGGGLFHHASAQHCRALRGKDGS